MNVNENNSFNESPNLKKNESYIISEEEEEEDEDEENNKKNENSLKNRASQVESDKNNPKIKKNNNNIKDQINFDDENNNKRIIFRNKNNIKNKIYLDKQTQKNSNKNLSSLLSSQKENKIIKEYNEIIKSDEEDKNKELLNRIKELEEKLYSSNKIINNLNNNKDIVIQKLTKTNKKLKNSLESISKKLDEKLLNTNLFKKRNINSGQKFGASFCTNNKSMMSGGYNNGPMSHLSDDIVTKNNNMLKEKELNNAVNMIKILTNDNKRLQNKVDEFEKNKVLEKEQKDKEKVKIDRELEEHKMCKEKMEQYKEKIRKLSDKNHILLEKISSIKSKKQNSCIFQIKNNNIHKNNNNNNNDLQESENENTEDNYKTKKKIIKKVNSSISLDKNSNSIINIKKIGFDSVKAQKGSLPKINTNKNKSKYNLNYNYQNNNNNLSNNNVNNIFNMDEMQQLNKVFKNNEDLFGIIVKKFEIMKKSKESLNTKYKIEKKQYIERIYSMQQHIDYLNGKIRENEFKINILQSQLNENNIHKKQLLKKVKILTAGIELSDLSSNNLIAENINKNESKDKNNEDISDNKATTTLNNTSINGNKKKLNGIRRRSFISGLNESNSLGDNIVDNLDNTKDQKNYNHNNSEFINEGDTILEENVSETSSKNRNLKLNNEDESEKNYKSFL